MPVFLGRQEVDRRKRRLMSLLAAIDGAALGPELTGHYARYLCVLVSGYAEQSIKELARQYTRNKSNLPIQRYVSTQIGHVRNIDLGKLKRLLDAFDPDWYRELSEKRPDELEAFGSVAALRNNISHGGDGSITIATLKQYFEQINLVLGDLCDRFDPTNGDTTI